MSSDRPRQRRRPGCCSYGCGGCAILLAAAAVVLGIVLSSAGRYRPVIPPPPPLPSPNGFDDYVAAGNSLKAAGGTAAAYAGRGPIPLAAAKVVVSRNAPALRMLRTGNTRACRVPAGRSFTALFPYLATTRDLARLLRCEQEVEYSRGHYAAVFDAGLDGIEMGQNVARGGPFIHELVGIACEAIVQPRMVDSVGRLSLDDCERLRARMEAVLLKRQPQSATFVEERAGMMVGLLEMKSPAGLTSASGTGGPNGTVESFLDSPFGRAGWRYMRDQALRELDEYMSVIIRQADMPAADRKPIPEPRSPIARIIIPVFSQGFAKGDEASVHDRILLCMLAIRGYRLQKGRLPASLADLGLDPRLMVDPYSGQRLIYHPSAGSYLLYSVGPDLKDNGGVPADQSLPLPQSGDTGPFQAGDYGVRQFRTPTQGGQPSQSYYRPVPHMAKPTVAKGAPRLFPE